MKTIITVTGIRPDFIRMSEIFKKLDQNFHHILVHTGQHYDRYLSNIFFKEFKIRKPDFNLNIGNKNNEHFHQLSILAIKFISLIRKKNIRPNLIIFLGDSNSVGLSFFLKKEGYKIAHIEAGMRSYDDRMLEEINRKVCDHCSDLLFVYHHDYKKNLLKENIKSKKIFVVGNTIVEPLRHFSRKIKLSSDQNNYILVDIHRPENFKYPVRLKNIFKYAEFCKKFFKKKIYFLKFKRTLDYIQKFKINTSNVSFVPLMSYTDFLKFQKNSFFIISDSGTAQEEPSLLHRPVIVPRDFSERPQSYANNCSFKINVNIKDFSWINSIYWINKYKNNKIKKNNRWLGSGKTSSKIIEILKKNI